jgi:methylated-DNA-[protein]-cysteine S-methyltransferase
VARRLATRHIIDMTVQGFAIFDTALGACGLAWSERGVMRVLLPDGDEGKIRSRLKRQFPDAAETPPPQHIARLIGDIIALMKGEARDFNDVGLDLSNVPPFNRKVFEIARTIPAGQTLTYGEIAMRLGDRLLARDVGTALGQNPFPIVVPCHRVLAASGKTGGFSAPGGVDTKMRMLSIERAQPGGPTLFGDLPLATRRHR